MKKLNLEVFQKHVISDPVQLSKVTGGTNYVQNGSWTDGNGQTYHDFKVMSGSSQLGQLCDVADSMCNIGSLDSIWANGQSE